MSDSGRVIGETNIWHPNYTGDVSRTRLVIRELADENERLRAVILHAIDCLDGNDGDEPPAREVRDHELTRKMAEHLDAYWENAEIAYAAEGMARQCGRSDTVAWLRELFAKYERAVAHGTEEESGRYAAETKVARLRAELAATEVMAVWAADEFMCGDDGELSIGQAVKLTGLDIVSLREAWEQLLARVQARWKAWRAENPPSPSGGENHG